MAQEREIADASSMQTTAGTGMVVQAVDGEEHFRLLGGFNDIFVLVGLALLTVGLGSLATLVPKNWLMLLPLAYTGVAWGLAEVFTRRMRLALPSIVLMMLYLVAAFCYSLMVSGALFTVLNLHGELVERSEDLLGALMLKRTMMAGVNVVIVATIMTALAGMLHYYRFKVPVGPALIFGMLFMAVALALGTVFPRMAMDCRWVMVGVFGLVSLGIAIMLDLKDPTRTTRMSDVAFWLHMQAAALLCQATMAPFFDQNVGSSGAIVTLVLFMMWSLLALLLNRRALIVSGLGYAAYALGNILYTFGVEKAGLVALCGIFVGSGVLVMAVAWQPMRRGLLRGLGRL